MDRVLLRQSIEKNITFSFARSSGKGGQNVNKVNTKVHAELPVNAIEGLTGEEQFLLRKKLPVNADGALFIDAEDERAQERNRAIARERLEQKIISAVKIQKRRKKTKPTAASVERRLKTKKLRAAVKQTRYAGIFAR